MNSLEKNKKSTEWQASKNGIFIDSLINQKDARKEENTSKKADMTEKLM